MRLVMVAFVAMSAACSSKNAPLPEPPGAQMIVSGKNAQMAIAIARIVGKTIPFEVPADAPFVAGLYKDGTIIVATKANASDMFRALASSAKAGAAPKTILGAVHQVNADTLARPDKTGRVFVALSVPEDRVASTAAILEVLAKDDAPTPATFPEAPDAIRVKGTAPLDALGPLDVVVKMEGNVVEIHAIADAASAAVKKALATSPPPWSCALDEGAIATLSVPPLDVSALDEESFSGRVLVAVYPRGADEKPAAGDPLSAVSIIIAGVPRDARAVDSLLGALVGQDVDEVRVGSRRTLSLKGSRLRAVVDDGLFALALGNGAPIERVSPSHVCDATNRPLLRGDGQQIAREVLPTMMTRETVLRALVSGDVDGSLPVPWLRNVGSVQIDARTEKDRVSIDARVSIVTN